MTTNRQPTSRWRSLPGQPLLQFLALGLIIFVAFVVISGERAAEERKRIVVSADQIELLASMWERQWRRPPTPRELEGLIQSHIREEVLYREALAMGFDRDDTVVRRRLAQKLEFLAQDLATQGEPTTAELQAFVDENRERFAEPPRVTFRHVYVNTDDRSRDPGEEAERLLAELQAGTDPELLGDRFMLEHRYASLSPDEVTRQFGGRFAAALFELTAGEWQGPVESGYGLHLVLVDARENTFLPPLDDVRRQVRDELISFRRREANETFYSRLREVYEVVIEAPSDAAGAPTSDDRAG